MGGNQGSVREYPPYRIVEDFHELNLLAQHIHPGLQLHLVHVGIVHVLQERQGPWVKLMPSTHLVALCTGPALSLSLCSTQALLAALQAPPKEPCPHGTSLDMECTMRAPCPCSLVMPPKSIRVLGRPSFVNRSPPPALDTVCSPSRPL